MMFNVQKRAAQREKKKKVLFVSVFEEFEKMVWSILAKVMFD